MNNIDTTKEKKEVEKEKEKSKARQAILKDNMEADFIAKGFRKLDSKFLTRRPPKIKWGKMYLALSDAEKIEYLQKLASTMNHAASLVQDERNELLKLCELKEGQIEQMKKAMVANDSMLHSEVEKINAERQSFNESKSGLKGNALKEQLKRWQQ